MSISNNIPASRLELPENPTLRDYQHYLATMVVERHFDHETIRDTLVLLMEEVGELAKAVRKSSGMMIDASSDTRQVADEVADIFILLGCLANQLGVDMEQAFRDKEAKSKQRTWQPASTSERRA